jgi:hypothetical protein
MDDLPKRPTRACSFRLERGNDAVRKQQEPQQQQESAPRSTPEQEDTAALLLEQDDDEYDESSVSYSVWLEALSPQAPRRPPVKATTTIANGKKAHSCYESSMPGLLSFSSHGSFAGDGSGLYLDLTDSISSLDCSVKNERTRKRGSFPDLTDSAANILQPRVLRDSSHREELRWGASNHSNDSMPSYRKRISWKQRLSIFIFYSGYSFIVTN